MSPITDNDWPNPSPGFKEEEDDEEDEEDEGNDFHITKPILF